MTNSKEGDLYLIAYSGWQCNCGKLNHQTILLRGKNEDDAQAAFYHKMNRGDGWRVYICSIRKTNA